jgi:ubiquinone/menaquinone biosynthesis C-methylase UbiE
VNADPSTGRDYLTTQQYATDANLAARQSIYVYQQPRVNIWGSALDLAGLSGDEAVLDVGCGNGSYLWALGQREHRGIVVGMDLSPGMLDAARARTRHPDVLLGDAQVLPFPDDSFDVVLAMHMLYHLPDRAVGIRELRRVLRDDGVMLAVTNSNSHLHEIDEIVRASAAGRSLPSNRLTFTLESGGAELRGAFTHVERHDMSSELVVTDVEPVVTYVMSMRAFVAGDELDAVVDEIRRRVAQEIAASGALRVRTAAGCFVCRP